MQDKTLGLKKSVFSKKHGSETLLDLCLSTSYSLLEHLRIMGSSLHFPSHLGLKYDDHCTIEV